MGTQNTRTIASSFHTDQHIMPRLDTPTLIRSLAKIAFFIFYRKKSLHCVIFYRFQIDNLSFNWLLCMSIRDLLEICSQNYIYSQWDLTMDLLLILFNGDDYQPLHGRLRAFIQPCSYIFTFINMKPFLLSSFA